MRVSCFQENLSKGLSIVGRAVSARSTLPVLGNILLEAKNDQLRLAATNLEIGINCWIGARVDDEGAVTVPSRLLAEFVNSLPPEQIERFFDGPDGNPRFDVAAGSREAPGARRIGEPWRRHFIGRVFNWVVRFFAVRGIQDTQCGFKLFSEAAANEIFRLQKLDGWAFDVELLFLARKAGFRVGEIAIDWRYDQDSRVDLVLGGMAFIDILRIRLKDLRGGYNDPENTDQ